MVSVICTEIFFDLFPINYSLPCCHIPFPYLEEIYGVTQTAFSLLPLEVPTERLPSKPPPVTVRGYGNQP